MLRYFPHAFPQERRRRLAPVFLLGGLLIVGKLAYEELPRDQRLRFVLPNGALRALRVTYSAGGEPYGGLERRFPDGAPAELVHTPSLAPGRYQLAIELTGPEGRVTRLDRSVELSGPDEVRIRLQQGDRER